MLLLKPIIATILASLVAAGGPEQTNQGLVAHEWGTFTSVAGRSGTSVMWAPLTGPSDVPCFVHRFGGFVDTRTNDTLHYIISTDVPEPLRTELNKLLVNISLWSGFWHFFAQRVDREFPTLSELAYGVEEFHHLVAQYGNFCIAPIFEHLPEQLRTALTGQSKVKLNTFRERYGQFLTEYMAFAKQFSESRPRLERLPRYLTYPTQL